MTNPDTTTRLEELERKFAGNPRRYFAALANEYRRRGETARAIELCRAQLAENPAHLSGHVVLGQALVDAGRGADAWSALRRALDLDPENFIALRLLGELAVQNGDRNDARTYFLRALQIEPRDERLLAAVAALDQVPVEQTVPEGRVEAHEPPEEVLEEVYEAGEQVHEAGEQVHEVSEQVHETSEQVHEVREEVHYAREEVVAEPEPAEPEPAELEPAELEPAEPVEPVEPVEPAPTAEPGEPGLPAPSGVVEPPPEPRPVLLSETMADLYLKQGHRAAAMQVLRELLAHRPEDERLSARLAELDQEPPAPRSTIRDLFARLGGARGAATSAPQLTAGSGAATEPSAVAALFGMTDAAPVDTEAAAPLVAAVASRPGGSPAPEDLEQWLARLRTP